MDANAFVRAHIDETLKNEAADVLAGMGLTVSDLVRIILTKVAVEKALPFDIRIHNRTTKVLMYIMQITLTCLYLLSTRITRFKETIKVI